MLFDHEIDRVEVRLPLSPSRDLDEAAALELLDESVDARDAHSDILREPILSGEAKVVVPRVAEQQRVDRLCADRDVGVAQDEIRDLGKSMQGHRIDGVERHVALKALHLIAYVFHGAIISPAAGLLRGLSPIVSRAVLGVDDGGVQGALPRRTFHKRRHRRHGLEGVEHTLGDVLYVIARSAALADFLPQEGAIFFEFNDDGVPAFDLSKQPSILDEHLGDRPSLPYWRRHRRMRGDADDATVDCVGLANIGRRRHWRRCRRRVGADSDANDDRLGLDQSRERRFVDEPFGAEDSADFFRCQTTFNTIALYRTPGRRRALCGGETLKRLSHGERIFEIVGKGSERGVVSVATVDRVERLKWGLLWDWRRWRRHVGAYCVAGDGMFKFVGH